MIDQMDTLLDQWLQLDLTATGNFQGMRVLRDALLNEGFSKDEANVIATSMTIEISQNVWDDYQEQVTGQLAKFAKVTMKLFEEVNDKFGMDAETFSNTFAKNLSYKLEM